ncbi:hypothetical protein Tdes44962_MAKER04620, partial [Teratosphaeria destructans]
ELEFYVDAFARNGLEGPCNWYRTRRINFEDELRMPAEDRQGLRQPVLFVQARRDEILIPAMSRGMEERIPRLTRAEVDAGHWVLWQRPGEVNELIGAWLEGVVNMDSLHSELIVSPPASLRAPSPPLAFAPTSNDSLGTGLLSPTPITTTTDTVTPITTTTTTRHSPPFPSAAMMGLLGTGSSPQERDMQVIVDQQNKALELLHEAFAAERQVWSLEKDRLYHRIASLEQLLRNKDHHSPAKSPVISPLNGKGGGDVFHSPPSRALSNGPRLPIIAEHENIPPLSRRRDGAPQSIDLPGRPPVPAVNGLHVPARSGRHASVGLDQDIKVDEIPVSPPDDGQEPHRQLAGHTPLRPPRLPTPPPKDMLLDGVEDTPTRNNTHINAFLTRSHDDDEDPALTGALNLPELPNKPDEGTFTIDALAKRLQQIESNPDTEGRPTVFAQPSPGLASPADPMDNPAAAPKTDQPSSATQPAASDLSSTVISPTAFSPPNGNRPLSPQEIQVHNKFEQGGIRLKKKPSSNFGAPFGQLGGFGSIRRPSHE